MSKRGEGERPGKQAAEVVDGVESSSGSKAECDVTEPLSGADAPEVPGEATQGGSATKAAVDRDEDTNNEGDSARAANAKGAGAQLVVVGDVDAEAEAPGASTNANDKEVGGRWTRLRRWTRRRWKHVLAGVLIAGLAARLLLPVAAPWLVAVGAEQLGLHASLGDLSLGLLAGEVEITDLRIGLDPNTPLVKVARLRADVSTWALLSGDVHVEHVTLDGLRVWVVRDSSGDLVAPSSDVSEAEPAPSDAPEANENEEGVSLPDLAWLRIDRVTVSDASVHLVDRAVTPLVERRVELDLSLRGFRGERGASPAELELDVFSEGLLGALRLRGRLGACSSLATAELDLRMSELRLRPLAKTLAGLGLFPRARSIDAQARISASLRQGDADSSAEGTAPGPAPRALHVEASVTDLAVTADGREALGLDLASLSANYGEGRLHVGEVLLSGARGRATRTSDGFGLAGIVLLERSPTAQAPQKESPGESAPAPAGTQASPRAEAPALGPTQESPAGPSLLVDRVSVADCWVEVHDETLAQPVTLRGSLHALSLSNLRVGADAAGATPATFSALASLPGLAEGIAVVGSGVQTADNAGRAGVSVSVDQLTLRALRPYLKAIGATSLWKQGSFRLRAEAAVSLAEDGTLGLDALVRELSLRDGDREWAGVDAVHVQGVGLRGGESPLVAVDTLIVARPRALVRTQGENVEVAGIRFGPTPKRASASDAGGAEPGAGPAAAQSAPSPPQPREAARGASDSEALPEVVLVAPVPRLPRLPEVHVGRVAVEDLGLRVEDADRDLVHDLRAGFSCEGVALVKGQTAAPATIHGWAEFPGVAERVTLDGLLTNSAPSPVLDLRLQASGLDGSPLAALVRPLGFAPDLDAGTFAARLHAEATFGDAAITAAASVSEVRLADARGPLFTLERVAIEGGELTTAQGKIAAIRTGEARLRVERSADGSIRLFGVRLLPPGEAPAIPQEGQEPSAVESPASARASSARVTSAEPNAAPSTPTPPEATIARPLVRATRGAVRRARARRSLHVELFKIGRVVVDAHDVESDRRLKLEAGLSLEGLRVRPNATFDELQPARLNAHLLLPGLVERTQVEGTLRVGAKLHAKAAVSLQGIARGALARDLLADLGIAPIDTQGAALELVVGVEVGVQPVLVDAYVRDLRLHGLDRDYLSLAALEVDGLRLPSPEDSRLRVQAVRVMSPVVRVHRDSSGRLEAAGFRFGSASSDAALAEPTASPRGEPPLPSDSEVTDRPPAPSAAQDSSPTAGAAGASRQARSEPLQAWLPAGLEIELGPVTLKGARFHWSNALTQRAFQAQIGATLQPLSLGQRRTLTPVRWSADLAIPTIVHTARIRGRLQTGTREAPLAGGDTLVASARFDVHGVQGAGLKGLLPEGTTATLHSGSLHLELEAQARGAERGGVRGGLKLKGLRWQDGDATLLALREVSAQGRRLDPAAGRIEFSEIALRGLETDVAVDAGGALEALGFRIAPVASRSGEVAAPPRARDPSQASALRPADASSSAAAASAPLDAGAQARLDEVERERRALLVYQRRVAARALRLGLPHVEITQLELELARLGLRRAGAKATTLRAHVQNLAPLILAGQDVASSPLTWLRIQASVSPGIERATLWVQATPLALQPHAELRWLVTGISTPELLAIAPELGADLRGDLNEGTLSGSLTLDVRPKRRESLNFAFVEDGFPAQLVLSDLALSKRDASGQEQILLGVQKADARVAHLSAEGTLVSRVEVTRPRFRVHKATDGMHVAGFVLPPPPEPAKQAGASEAADASDAPKRDDPSPTGEAETGDSQRDATPRPPAAPPPPPHRIVKFTVREVDGLFEDRTTTPPVRVPLARLELDLKGLDLRALSEKRRIKLSLRLDAGEVPLEGVEPHSAPAWKELEVKANLGLFPAPNGQVTVELQDLQLRNLAGLAAQNNVIVNDGVTGVSVKATLDTEQDLVLRTRTYLSRLSVSEPADGFLRRTLKLPAPLDVVLGALTPDDEHGGTIDLPLNLSVNLERGDVGPLLYLEITTLLGRLIARAIARAPDRIARKGLGLFVPDEVKKAGTGFLNSVLPFGDDDGPPTLEIKFNVQAAQLSEAERAAIAGFAKRLARHDELTLDLRHDLSPLDRARAVALLRPPAKRDRRALVRRLTSSVAEARAALDRAMARARLGLLQRPASERTQADLVEAQRRLRRLADLEGSLASALALLDNETGAHNPVREALLKLGRDRLALARAILQRVAPKVDPQRIRVTPVSPEAKRDLQRSRVVLDLVKRR